MRSDRIRGGAASPADQDENVLSKLIEAGAVSLAIGANHQINSRSRTKPGQQLDAHEFADTTLEPVSVHRGVLVFRHDHSNARTSERGSNYPDVEIRAPDSLPLSNDAQDVAAPR